MYRKFKLRVISLILRAINWVAEYLSDYTKHPKCPHCGADAPTENSDNCWYDTDCEEVECHVCGEYYDQHVSVDITWCTEKTWNYDDDE
jgi:hypothetical protein